MKEKILTGLLMIVAISFAKLPIDALEKVTIDGLYEFNKGESIIIDGQRVKQSAETRIENDEIKTFEQILIGSKIKVNGFRMLDGSIVAEKIEVDKNESGILEFIVVDAANELEKTWIDSGNIRLYSGKNEVQIIGTIIESGSSVQRVKQIFNKIKPQYLAEREIRIIVVENNGLNAYSMANGTIIVQSGLVKEFSDDELAIVLGHELAHYTNGHIYKQFIFKNAMNIAKYGLSKIKNKLTTEEQKQKAILLAADMAEMVGKNQYNQSDEKQADRVGLRYAVEGGFNAKSGPVVWEKFGKKYKDENAITNFFVGDHPTFEKRKKSMLEEIKYNY